MHHHRTPVACSHALICPSACAPPHPPLLLLTPIPACVRACVRACWRACVRACVHSLLCTPHFCSPALAGPGPTSPVAPLKAPRDVTASGLGALRTGECVDELLLKNVSSYYRMCSLTIECVLLLLYYLSRTGECVDDLCISCY
jgi:hypothetical protein